MVVEWNPELTFLIQSGWWISAEASVTYIGLYSKMHVVNSSTIFKLCPLGYKIKKALATFEIYFS